MQRGQTSKGWKRFTCGPAPKMSVYIAAIAVLFMGAAAEAAAMPSGLSLEMGGVKISLKLSSPDGTKVIFQRADSARH